MAGPAAGPQAPSPGAARRLLCSCCGATQGAQAGSCAAAPARRLGAVIIDVAAGAAGAGAGAGAARAVPSAPPTLVRAAAACTARAGGSSGRPRAPAPAAGPDAEEAATASSPSEGGKPPAQEGQEAQAGSPASARGPAAAAAGASPSCWRFARARDVQHPAVWRAGRRCLLASAALAWPARARGGGCRAGRRCRCRAATRCPAASSAGWPAGRGAPRFRGRAPCFPRRAGAAAAPPQAPAAAPCSRAQQPPRTQHPGSAGGHCAGRGGSVSRWRACSG